MPTTAHTHQRYAAAVTCIDGRIQETLRQHIVERFQVDHVDMVTIPGADAALAADPPGDGAPGRACALTGIGTSRSAHGSRVVVIAGHTDCAGNQVDHAGHLQDLQRAAQWLTTEFPQAHVVGLLIETDSGDIHEIAATSVEMQDR